MLVIADEDADLPGSSTMCAGTGTTDSYTIDTNVIGTDAVHTDTMCTNAIDADSTHIGVADTGTIDANATSMLCSTPFFIKFYNNATKILDDITFFLIFLCLSTNSY